MAESSTETVAVENAARWERITGIVAYVAAVATGAFLRFFELTIKPLHSDEGVNGWFLMNLFRGLHKWGHWMMNYRYDPTNYHGPFLYFFGLIPFFAIGPSTWSLRLFPALAGTACLGILWFLRKHLGWAGLAFAAWLMAISPPFVFFSRTAIHEIYVFFFSLAAVVCFVNSYRATGTPGAARYRVDWMTFGIVSCAFIFTNKETSVITFVAFLIAAVLAWLFARFPAPAPATAKKKKDRGVEQEKPSLPGGAITEAAVFAVFLVGPVLVATCFFNRNVPGAPGFLKTALAPVAFATSLSAGLTLWLFRWQIRERLRAASLLIPVGKEEWSDYGLAFAWAAAITVILFTSFFTNPKGAYDMFATYGTWIGRGNQGAGHDKPFLYWFELLREYDAPILWLGLLGTIAAAWRRDRFGIFIVVWGWALWLVYSVIAYKTPWCNLNWTGPGCILGGILLREISNAVGKVQPMARVLIPLTAPLVVCFFPVPAGPVLGASVAAANPKGGEGTTTWARFMWDVNFVHSDDDRYKIIYVQTVRDFETLVDRVNRIFKEKGEKTTTWVTSGDYWPMPFYLREHDGVVGYYQGKIPEGTPASVVVASSTQEAELRERLEGYRLEHFMLRPGVVLSMYVEPAIYDPLFGNPDAIGAAEPPPADASRLAPGLIAEYRYGIGCTGPLLEGRVDKVPEYAGYGKVREFQAPVCATWRGFVRIDEAAEYSFTDASDDGSWIWLDGEQVLDNGGTHGAIERQSVLAPLTPGLHSFQVRYFDAGGGAELRVGLVKKGGTKVPLEPLLVHDKEAEKSLAPAAGVQARAGG